MPPKGRTKSAGSKLAWESELVAAELNDSEWSTQVHYILGDTPQATAETCERLNKAQVTRERFSILTAEYILASIQDKKNRPTSAKFSEVFDSCKHVETGADITDINDLGPVQLARLVKFFLLRQKDLDLTRIQAKTDKAAAKANDASKGKKTPPAAGKGKRSASAKKVYLVVSMIR